MPSPIRILYMEDNEGTARLLQKRLARSGYAVDVVLDGEEGLARMAAHHYDVVLIDYKMPSLNGLQVMHRLAEQGELPTVIMLTGTGNEQVAVDALKLGATDYVVKDVDGVYLDLLPTIIEQGLRNRQLLEDKRRAEEALKRSEQYHRALIENSLDLIVLTDEKGVLTYVSPSIRQISDIDEQQLVGLNGLDLIAPRSADPAAGDILKKAETFFRTLLDMPGSLVETEFWVRANDESQYWLEVRGRNLLHEPWIAAIVFNIRDVTWRKQIEAQMQAHIEQLQTLRKIDTELTYRLDIDYVLTLALDTMLRVSGADAGSIHVVDQGRVVQTKSVGYPESAQTAVVERSMASQAVQQNEPEWVRNVADDPNCLPILLDTVSQITIPLLSQERLVGVLYLETMQGDLFTNEQFEFLKLIASRVSVAIDNARLYHTAQEQLAELQSLYVQLTELEQLKTDMIRVASHDLRNPLAVVGLDIYILRRTLGEQLSEQERKYLDQIDNAAKQMQAITTDFLSFDRFNLLADNEIRSQQTDLHDLVRSTFASFQPQVEQKAQTYRLHIPETPVVVTASKAELQRVIANLIGNAIKYTPEGGTVDVQLWQDEHLVQFQVIDSGYGIPLEQQDKLFRPFFRVPMKEAASIDGTGLGLYLAKKLIERNNGQILFHSEYGKGSTFGFKLFL